MWLALTKSSARWTHPDCAEEQPVVTRVGQAEPDIGSTRPQQALSSVAAPPGRSCQCLSELAKAERQHLPHQLLLAREVAVDRRRGNPDRHRYRPDADVPGVASIREKMGGGLKQLRAKALSLTLSIAGSPGHAIKFVSKR